jgi:thiol:disulfide interchange protein DsbC
MRRIVSYTLSMLAAVLIFGGSAVAEDDKALTEVRAKIDAMFDEIGPEHVNTSPVNGWYTVQKGSIVAYVSSDGRYLLQGDLIDLEEQVNLTEVSRADARRTLLAGVADDEVIMFSPAEKKFSVTVFTDVDCTYCRKLHNQIDEYLAQGIEIRYMLYPRNGPASPSWIISENVWCASNRNTALTAAKLDRSFESHGCDASMVTNHFSKGQDIGLSGTPAIVLDDGTLISGYLPPADLSAKLQQAALN